MNTAKRSENLTVSLIGVWLVTGAAVLWAPVGSRAINAVPPGTAAAQEVTAAAPGAPPARYSAGIADILKLVDARVDPEVIKTFIKNSPTGYNPSAEEIIGLKNRGVGSEILTTILQRGAEVRAQAMRAGQAAAGGAAPQPPAGAVNPYAPAPASDYSAQGIYPNYTYSYPAVSYAYPSYSYAYPAYYSGYYDYGWPYFWPSLSFNFGYYPYGGYCGYRYPYWGRYGCGYYSGYGGYWGRGGYYGHGGYYGRGGYYGHRGYYGGPHNSGGRPIVGASPRPVPRPGPVGGFRSVGGGSRPATFTSFGGASRGGGGFGGRAVSFGGGGGRPSGHAMSVGSRGGGFGGRGGGRGR